MSTSCCCRRRPSRSSLRQPPPRASGSLSDLVVPAHFVLSTLLPLIGCLFDRYVHDDRFMSVVIASRTSASLRQRSFIPVSPVTDLSANDPRGGPADVDCHGRAGRLG